VSLSSSVILQSTMYRLSASIPSCIFTASWPSATARRISDSANGENAERRSLWAYRTNDDVARRVSDRGDAARRQVCVGDGQVDRWNWRQNEAGIVSFVIAVGDARLSRLMPSLFACGCLLVTQNTTYANRRWLRQPSKLRPALLG